MLSPDIELQNTVELRATASEIAAPKPDLGASQNAPKQKKHGFEALSKMNLKRQINSSKIKKISDKSLSQPSCRHSNTIYDVQLQKTIVLRMQPRQQATLTHPLQCYLQIVELRARASEIAAPKPDLGASQNAPKQKKHGFEALSKMNLKRQINSSKIKKISDKSLSQPSCRHSNTIYDAQLQKTIVLRMQPRRQATVMQPLQCVWQHHVANSHVATHMATEHDNNHAAIPLRSATTDSKTPYNMYNYACTNTSKAASTHRYGPGTKKHRNERTATAAHTSCLSSPAAATLHEKNQVSCSGFLPNTTPCNIHATITMRFAGSRG